MSNQTRVCWLHHSKVYHRARFRYDERCDDGAILVPCGVTVASSHFRCMEGSRQMAEKRHHLRPCHRCFPPSAPCNVPGATR